MPRKHNRLRGFYSCLESTSEKKQRLSIGRNRQGCCIFVSRSLASPTICVLSPKILRGCAWGLLETQLISLCCSQFRNCTLEEAGTDTRGVSVIASSCPVSNQTSLLCGKCVQTSQLLLKPFRAMRRGVLEKKPNPNTQRILIFIYIHLSIYIS